MKTGKIELDVGAIQDLMNHVINLRLDLEILKRKVAEIDNRVICQNDDCPHCAELKESLRKAQPPTKKGK